MPRRGRSVPERVVPGSAWAWPGVYAVVDARCRVASGRRAERQRFMECSRTGRGAWRRGSSVASHRGGTGHAKAGARRKRRLRSSSGHVALALTNLARSPADSAQRLDSPAPPAPPAPPAHATTQIKKVAFTARIASTAPSVLVRTPVLR
jgi:hypothetical protein